MAVTTSASQIVDDILRVIALSNNSDARTYVQRAVEQVAYDVWMQYPWHERKKEAYVNTVAPYDTGTVTLTLASTTITGSGTTFVEGMVGRKIALSYDDPYYKIDTFTSTTVMATDRAYVEATASGSSYVIYDDMLMLVEMDALLAGSLIVMSAGYDYPLDDLTSAGWDNLGHMPRVSSRPTAFRLVPDDGGRTTIQVWPVPDAAYAIRYEYLQKYEDFGQIHESRRDVVMAGASARAFRYIKKFDLAREEDRRFETLLSRAIKREKRLYPRSVILRPFDQPMVRGGRTGRFYWKP